MDSFEIKATILRSNPQIMRQIRMGAGHTIGELGQIVCAAIGIDMQMPLSISRDGKTLDPSSFMKGQLYEGDCLELSFQTKLQWKILIEVKKTIENEKGKETDTLFLPKVTRYRGLNASQAAETAGKLNTFQDNALCRKNTWNYRQKEKDEYGFEERQFEKRMRQLLTPEAGADREINLRIGEPLANLLDSWNLVDLREIAEEKKIGVNTRQNKKSLVREMAAQMTKDSFLKEVLCQMSVQEYRNFERLCYEENAYFEGGMMEFPILGEYSMIARSYQGEYLVPKELLRFYDGWRGSEEEKKAAFARQIRTCIMAGCHLYAVLSREQAERIYQHCYPETYRKSLFLEEWKAFLRRQTGEDDIVVLNPSTVYDSCNMSRRDATAWISQARLKQDRWYLPDREEMERISLRGVYYPAETEKEFDSFLKRYTEERDSYLREFLIGVICQMCHVNMDTDEITDFVKKRFHLGLSARATAKLGELIDRHRDEVREVGTYGYTRKEFVEVING